ncbi:hypothetical protein C7999DRAFT_18274 [Corynascus novoguineensis]|uniref:DnaJ homologue subfamily C member 28 conserved domain-containing protein n=1 Tax=Corynascus novoguineensis TaxID=1126955 RepID=A0AAN7HFH9_9PEZI|nr:hypothetical protein C7999DRAFT_18274 [Corynascus novoguineensis]
MASTQFVCASCARSLRANTIFRTTLPPTHRYFSRSARTCLPTAGPSEVSPLSEQREGDNASSNNPSEPSESAAGSEPQPGAMASRLQQATEEALLTGGRAGRRAIEEAGFSEELKAQLLDKIAGARFQHEHSAALAQAGVTSRIPDSAGLGTRAMASAQPWTGSETTEDAVLRMLDDARKPLAPGLRGKAKPPVPQPVDMRIRREVGVTPGRRAAGARDKAQTYAGLGLKGVGLSEEEREELKKEFRERFTPVARAMPSTLTGLASLANERIEDAIARGQFKNIPRGKGVERDTRADNPFIDTTEYIMNKMIKRQDIVPPWIEKQQELIKAAENFRGRLRNDWKRHAARMISSHGGTLEQQVARAEAYARAEEAHNPRRRGPEQISIPTSTTDDAVKLQTTAATASLSPPPSSVSTSSSTPTLSEPSRPPSDPSLPTRPFRDPAWEAAERSYMTLAIENLNTITRSYNLMAPELARKPYFSLERELRACFADVAPHVAGEIRARATRPARSLVDDHPFGNKMGPIKGGGSGSGGGSLGALFGGGVSSGVSVVEGKDKEYGLKEFWRDLFGAKGKS